MYNILICDDEKDIVNALMIYLQNDEHRLFPCHSGQEALKIMEEEEIHLVLLDVMMPELDGIATLAKIRETSHVPVIFLTAKSEDADKVLGLNLGADDYVTKPFAPVELQARVHSHLRRYTRFGAHPDTMKENSSHLTAGSIELDDAAKRVTLDGEEISLTRTEYAILKFLMEHKGEVFSPKDIYREVWNDAPLGAESTVAVHIRHLREKIEINPAEPRYLKVVWGHGYKIEG